MFGIFDRCRTICCSICVLKQKCCTEAYVAYYGGKEHGQEQRTESI